MPCFAGLLASGTSAGQRGMRVPKLLQPGTDVPGSGFFFRSPRPADTIGGFQFTESR